MLLRSKSDPIRSALHERFKRLRLDMIGAHDPADERIREELLNCWTIALGHEVSVRFGGESGRGLLRDASVDSHHPLMLLGSNSH
jgi:hypothetical protein